MSIGFKWGICRSLTELALDETLAQRDGQTLSLDSG